MKHKIIIANHSKTSATLLVPEFLMNKLRKQESQFMSLTNVFHYFVRNQKSKRFHLDKTKSGNTVYQSKGMQLNKIYFFPYKEDWEQFRLYAYSMRISMTYLFVLLLLYWEKFEPGDHGVPQQNTTTTLIYTLRINKAHTIIELQRLNI